MKLGPGGERLFLAPPPRISVTTKQSYKIQSTFDSPVKTRRETNFIDLEVTDAVTGQVKCQMFHRSRMFHGMRYNIE